jgi:hypothetical protein
MIYKDRFDDYFVAKDTEEMSSSGLVGPVEFFGSPSDIIPNLDIWDYIPVSINAFIGKRLETLWVHPDAADAFYENYMLSHVVDEYTIIMPKTALNELLYDI